MSQFTFYMTTQGLALLAKAQAGTALNFTRCAAGSGTLESGADPTAFTDLISRQQYMEINSISAADQKAKIVTILNNTDLETSFYIRELGVYATDPDDGEIIYAYGYAGDEADYLPAADGTTVVEQQYDLYIIVGSATNITATIDSSTVYVTQDEFQEHTGTNVYDDGGVHGFETNQPDSDNDGQMLVWDNTNSKHVYNGNAPTASKLATAIDIALTGLINGSESFDGSSNFSIETALPLSSVTYYVDASVSASGDGISSSTAFKTIQEALTAVSNKRLITGNVTIYVAAGSYSTHLRLYRTVIMGYLIINFQGDVTINTPSGYDGIEFSYCNIPYVEFLVASGYTLTIVNGTTSYVSSRCNVRISRSNIGTFETSGDIVLGGTSDVALAYAILVSGNTVFLAGDGLSVSYCNYGFWATCGAVIRPGSITFSGTFTNYFYADEAATIGLGDSVSNYTGGSYTSKYATSTGGHIFDYDGTLL